MKYTLETKWGSHHDCIPTVYTYTFETSMVYTREESKNIVDGTWRNVVRVTMPGKPQRVSTYMSLKRFLARSQRVTELSSKPNNGTTTPVE